MKIAIIGSGISGLSCAYYLHKKHDIQIYEANDYIGGHTATVDVELGGRRYAIDTGFIVYNDWTYPNFIELLDRLGVHTKATAMSFSYSDQVNGLEYAGSGINTLFAQRRNLVSPSFWRMLRDIVRFNKHSVTDLESGAVPADMSLGAYLDANNYSPQFRDNYLIPMGSAIWSADVPVMLDFPLQFFIRFFRNHGLLNIVNRPQWHVIAGGSREYIAPLTAGFADRIHRNAAVQSVSRDSDGVNVTLKNGASQRFDHVVFACHSDQALGLLADADIAEQQVLGALPYQDNEVVLHTDTRLLPRNKLTWSSWNYLQTGQSERATLTYNMNILQGISAPETFCVTLNNSAAINSRRVLGRFNYAHPVFTLEGMTAQERWQDINTAQTSFCGAYWRNGFHEDGVWSARRVAETLDQRTSTAATPSLVNAA